MRFILKKDEPVVFRQWKNANENSPQNLSYDNVPSAVKETIKESLLQEQGYLCGYTLRRISAGNECHIEHIKAQSKYPDEDLNYSNLLACVPSNGGDASLGYGAPTKANNSIVSPLENSIEDKFSYDASGVVRPTNADDKAIDETINFLKLNHPTLRELRQQAITAHGLSLRTFRARKTLRPLSIEEAKLFAEQVLLPNDNGKLEPFCVVLSHIAKNYILKLNKLDQDVQHAA